MFRLYLERLRLSSNIKLSIFSKYQSNLLFNVNPIKDNWLGIYNGYGMVILYRLLSTKFAIFQQYWERLVFLFINNDSK